MVDSINYSHNHADGFTSEGTLTQDKLFDDFDVVRKLVILSGQGVLPRGTALGKVTSSGKWVKSASASSDGSQIIRAISLHAIDATSADAEVMAGRRGSCNPAAVTFGTGHTYASADDACMDRGIIFNTVIGG
jgi:hypothetical protein